MKRKCPGCNNLINILKINKKDGSVFCDVCKSSFTQMEIYEHNKQKEQSPEDILKNPPKGTYLLENNNQIIIGTSTRSIYAGIFTLIAGAFLSVIPLFSYGYFQLFINYITITDNVLTNPQTYINILFLLLTSASSIFIICGFLFCILMAINGKAEIIIGKESYAFTGIGKIGRKKSFDWNSTRKIYKKVIGGSLYKMSSGSRTRSDKSIEIIIEGKNKVKFGQILGGLYYKQFFYILNVLQNYHKQKVKK